MLSTVPAKYFAQVIPEVLAAGGNGLALNGLVLTNGTRTPIGTIPSFTSLVAVGNYFGIASQEYATAAVYFGSFNNSGNLPGAILYAQYNQNAAVPYIRGGSMAATTLQQLQGYSGALSVTLNGVVKTSSTINLSAATSFSNAATLIQAQFANLYDGVTGSGSSIAAGTATNVTASTITGNVFTAAGTVTGAFVVGGVLSGTGVTAGTYILNQLSGTAGGAGTYTVSINQNVASTTITQAYGVLTVVTMLSGALAVGQVLSGGTTAANTAITALGTGTGQAGTYITSGGAQTVSATTISAGPLSVTYDSIASAFVVTGGTPGAVGTIAYASGGISASLLMTSVTGAVLSQGADAASPTAFMDGIIAKTTNWATFMTTFNPDAYGNSVKLAFAQWNNTQVDEYIYVCWDADITPTASFPATSSLGYLLNTTYQYDGTCLVYDPNNEGVAAFVCGLVASINFQAVNGNINPTYKSQSGLAATVTDQTVLSNLQQNGYNCIVASATAAQEFIFLWNGQISGKWLWLQPYINQIWMNASFQLALMLLLTNAKSIPYNAPGMATIHASLMDTINQALNFGAIQPGVSLSGLQISLVNTAACLPIDQVLSTRGWYLQVLAPTPSVRQARGTPVCNFWYTDGGSVQQITMTSVDLL